MRAIFTAFSTASAPELNSAVRFSKEPGVSRLRCSATATYSSYGVTMKQVWVKSATCSRTASTTRGEELPIVVTAMPEPRSMNRLPSTSSRMPPAGPGGEHRHRHPDGVGDRRDPAFGQSRATPVRGSAVTSLRLCSTVVVRVFSAVLTVQG